MNFENSIESRSRRIDRNEGKLEELNFVKVRRTESGVEFSKELNFKIEVFKFTI